MAVEGTIAAAAVSGVVAAFPKFAIELVKPVLPAIIVDTLHENKINSCTKKPEPDGPSFKQMGPATMKRVTSDENYIDIDWREYEVAEKALKLVHENLHNENSYEKIANTCAKLIELYAMKSSRKTELIHIRDTIMKVDPALAEKIEIDKFSQCAFYEGRIMLYR
jgi:hypothetical protein